METNAERIINAKQASMYSASGQSKIAINIWNSIMNRIEVSASGGYYESHFSKDEISDANKERLEQLGYIIREVEFTHEPIGYIVLWSKGDAGIVGVDASSKAEVEGFSKTLDEMTNI